VDWAKVTSEDVGRLTMNDSYAKWQRVQRTDINDPARRFPPGEPVVTFLLAVTYATAPDVIQAFIEGGAPCDGTGPDSPLMYAAQFNQKPQIIGTLIDCGAPVTADLGFSTQARPALTYAAQRNPAAEVVAELIKRGAKVNAKVNILDNTGFAPLLYAAQSNKNPKVIAELIVNGADIELADAMGQTALVLAVKYNENPQVLRVLIDAGARVDFTSDDYVNQNMTPLMYAAMSSSYPVEKMHILLEAGANPGATSKEGKTAFDYARDNSRISPDEPIIVEMGKRTALSVREGASEDASRD
jgi:hypothetical protein